MTIYCFSLPSFYQAVYSEENAMCVNLRECRVHRCAMECLMACFSCTEETVGYIQHTPCLLTRTLCCLNSDGWDRYSLNAPGNCSKKTAYNIALYCFCCAFVCPGTGLVIAGGMPTYPLYYMCGGVLYMCAGGLCVTGALMARVVIGIGLHHCDPEHFPVPGEEL